MTQCNCDEEHDWDHQVSYSEVISACEEWLSGREPISMADFNTLESTFIRNVGEKTTHIINGRAAENKHLRRVKADEIGAFAHANDIPLIETGDRADYADLFGYPAAEGYIPILVTAPDDGDLSVRERFHVIYHDMDEHGFGERIAITDGGEEAGPPCFYCGAPADERFGSSFICEDCIPDETEDDEDDASTDATDETEATEGRAECRWNTTGDHENPIDVLDVSDEERAEMLQEFIDRIEEDTGKTPLLMPLKDEKKMPIIRDRARLETPRGRSFLVRPEKAIRDIREKGKRGYCIYADKESHNTEGIIFCDHDEPDEYPTPTGEPTLEVMSGSGGDNAHETYINEGDVEGAIVGDDFGEIRVNNQYVVTPGSVHPAGGIYHITDNREIATLSDDELTDEMRPSTSASSSKERTVPEHIDPEEGGDLPDDQTEQELLEMMFDNPHDGDELKRIWDGRWQLTHHQDRSSAEYKLACRLDQWIGRGSTATVRRLMNDSNAPKWHARGKSYEESVLAGVGSQDWYYDPDSPTGDGEGTPDLLSAAYDEAGEPDPSVQFASTLGGGVESHLSEDEMIRHLRKRGKCPSTSEVRRRLSNETGRAMEEQARVNIEAPTSAGKTHTVATEEFPDDQTGGQRVVQLLPTRDSRDEAKAASEAAGRHDHVLQSRKEACPVASGEHDPENAEDGTIALTVNGTPVSEFIDYQCDHKGLSFSWVHGQLTEWVDQPIDEIPCEMDGPCWTHEQWDWMDDEDPDIVFATHNFAHVPSLRMNTNVVFDEQPDYTIDLSTERVRRMITSYLQEIDAIVQTWETFISLALTPNDAWDTDAGAEKSRLRDQLESREPDAEWFINDDDAHAAAGGIAKAIFFSEERSNNRRVGDHFHEPPRLDAHAHDDLGWNREWVTVVLDGNNDIQTIRQTPDLSQARSVIGLDAHPCVHDWQDNTIPDMEERRVLSDEERRNWRLFERGLSVVQTTENTYPLSGAKETVEDWFPERKTKALIEAINEKEGGGLSTAGITAQAEDLLEEVFKEAGVNDPDLMHYGEERSRNDFEDEDVGLVMGSMDPGDEYILNRLAERGLEAAPEMHECELCGGDGCGDDDQCRDGERRVKGRGFVGPDAEAAEELLQSIRENRVAQMAGRYARNPDDPDSKATVYLHTDAAPEGFVDAVVPGVQRVYTEKQQRIVEHVAENEGATTREIDEAGIASKDYARRVLQSLEEETDGRTIVAHENAERYGATLYEVVADPGEADVELGEAANRNVTLTGSNSTWYVVKTAQTLSEQPSPMKDQSEDEQETGWQEVFDTDPPAEADD